MPAMKDPSALTAESVAILNRGMIQACDKLDGVEDGIIADPRRCTVDPVQFQCSETQKTDCLTPVQVEAARHIYAGATKSDGTRADAGPGARQRAGLAGAERRRNAGRQQLGFLAPGRVPGSRISGM